MFLNLGHHSGHENSGCSFASGQGAGGFAPACGASGWRGPYTGRGRAAVRGGARNGQRLDGPLGARRESGAEGRASRTAALPARSEEHTSELQSLAYLVCRLLLEKKKKR